MCRLIVSGKPLGFIKKLNENFSLISVSPLFLQVLKDIYGSMLKSFVATLIWAKNNM